MEQPSSTRISPNGSGGADRPSSGLTADVPRVPGGEGTDPSRGDGLADHAKQAKQQVASLAHAADERARGMLGDIGDDVSREAESQKARLATLARELSSELHRAARADSSDETDDTRVARLAEAASARTGEFARWLETHAAGDLLDGIRDYARRRPMTFIAASALAGLVMGRLTRGMTRGSDESSADRPPQPRARLVGREPAVSDPLATIGTLDERGPADPTGWRTGAPAAVAVRPGERRATGEPAPNGYPGRGSV